MQQVYFIDTYFYNRQLLSTEKDFITNHRSDDGFVVNQQLEDSMCEYDSDADSDREFGGYGYNAKMKIRSKKHARLTSTRRKFIATMFGKTLDGKSIAVHILKYKPVFWVKISDDDNPDEIIQTIKRKFSNYIRVKHAAARNIKYTVERRIDYSLGFTNGKLWPFLKMEFSNSNSMRKWYKHGFMKIDKYKKSIYGYKEGYAKRFFHKKILPSGWHTITGPFINLSHSAITRCDYEISTYYDDSVEFDPTMTAPPILVKFAMDIETAPVNTRKRGIAKYRLENMEMDNDLFNKIIKKRIWHPILTNDDIISQIGVSILTSPMSTLCDANKNTNKNAKNNNRLDIILSVGPDLKNVDEQLSENLEYKFIACKSERNVLIEFINLYKKHIPDCTLTYNGNQYDWDWIKCRAKSHGLYKDFLLMSKFKYMKCVWNNNKTNSVQMGTVNRRFIKLPGCLNIDLLPIFARSGGTKLLNLKLDTVSKYYLPPANMLPKTPKTPKKPKNTVKIQDEIRVLNEFEAVEEIEGEIECEGEAEIFVNKYIAEKLDLSQIVVIEDEIEHIDEKLQNELLDNGQIQSFEDDKHRLEIELEQFDIDNDDDGFEFESDVKSTVELSRAINKIHSIEDEQIEIAEKKNINQILANNAKIMVEQRKLDKNSWELECESEPEIHVENIVKNIPNKTDDETDTNVEGEGKVDLPYQDMFLIVEKVMDKTGDLDERQRMMEIVGKYCIQDCVLLHKLVDRCGHIVDILIGAQTAMIAVNVEIISGVGAKILGIMSKFALEDNFLINSYVLSDMEIEEVFWNEIVANPEFAAKYYGIINVAKPALQISKRKKFMKDYIRSHTVQGAFVFPPTMGIYKNIPCLDVKSEYPSVIRAYNISCDRLVLYPEYDNLPGVEYIDIEWTKKDPKHGVFVARYATDLKDRNRGITENKGILVKAIEYYLFQRGKVKKLMKELIIRNEKQQGMTAPETQKTPEYIVLNAKQLALKVICNSFYGICNYKKSPIYCQPLAGCTTSMARKYIGICRDMVLEWYGASVVYGDTDSIFIGFPPVKHEITNDDVKQEIIFKRKKNIKLLAKIQSGDVEGDEEKIRNIIDDLYETEKDFGIIIDQINDEKEKNNDIMKKIQINKDIIKNMIDEKTINNIKKIKILNARNDVLYYIDITDIQEEISELNTKIEDTIDDIKIYRETAQDRKEFYRIWDLAADATKRLNDLMVERDLPTLEMDLEKNFVWLMLMSVKKHYIGEMSEERDYEKTIPKIMGMSYKKRDSSGIEKIAGREVIKFMKTADIKGFIRFLRILIAKIYNGVYDYTYFYKGQKYKDAKSYKFPERMLPFVAVSLIKKYDPGQPVFVGDRIFWTYRKIPTIFGPRGGKKPKKRVDQCWPALLIGSGLVEDPEIDYAIFVGFIVNTMKDILELEFGINGHKKFLKEELSKYE